MIDYAEMAPDVEGQEPFEKTTSRYSISFRLSLTQRTGEGVSISGDAHMGKTSTGRNIPQRASRASLVQAQYAAPPTQHFNDEDDNDVYEDVPLDASPLGNVLYKPSGNKPTRPHTTHVSRPTIDKTVYTTRTLTSDVPVPTHRVSGSTRILLWIVLVLCIMFLANGVIVPIITNAATTMRYGYNHIASFDMQSKHFVTQDAHNRISVLVSDTDGSHSQLLTTVVGGNTDRALVTLIDSGSGKVEVEVDGTHLAYLKRDSKGGYSWMYQ